MVPGPRFESCAWAENPRFESCAWAENCCAWAETDFSPCACFAVKDPRVSSDRGLPVHVSACPVIALLLSKSGLSHTKYQ
jgi:hypothetical protein